MVIKMAHELFFSFSTIITLVTVYLLGKIRDSGSSDRRMRSFYSLVIAMLGWQVLNAITVVMDRNYFAFITTVEMVFVCIIPYASTWFLLNFTRSHLANSRILRYALVLIPTLDIMALLTNPIHFLYFLSYDYPRAPVGPIWVIHLGFTVVTLVFISIILIRYIVTNIRHSPILVFGIGIVIPFILNMLYKFDISSIEYNVAPLGFFFAVLFFYYFTKISGLDYVSRLNSALAEITELPELASGVLENAASVIAKTACRTLNTHRVGIWTTSGEAETLRNLSYYNLVTDEHTVQGELDITICAQYRKLLQSERLIIINDATKPNPLSPILDEYRPDIRSLLDAPIRIGGRLVGVVCIEQDKCPEFPVKREWTTDEQNFASSLADLMALAIESGERFTLMRRNEDLMNNLPGMVYQCLNDPPEFTFTFVSAGSKALLGYTPDELTGNSTLKFFDMVHPDDVEMLEQQNAVTLLLVFRWRQPSE